MGLYNKRAKNWLNSDYVLGIVLGIKKNKKKDLEFLLNPLSYCGGSDETRTRDLRRDRPAF